MRVAVFVGLSRVWASEYASFWARNLNGAGLDSSFAFGLEICMVHSNFVIFAAGSYQEAIRKVVAIFGASVFQRRKEPRTKHLLLLQHRPHGKRGVVLSREPP